MNELAKFIVEAVIGDPNKKVTVLLPGGFKPPHAGHLEIAMAYYSLPEVDKVIVLIGPETRDGITRDQSMAIWKRLTEDVPSIIIQPTQENSPLTAAYKFIETAPRGTYALAASSKGGDYERVNRFVHDHSVDGKYHRPEINVVELVVNPKPLIYTGRSDNFNKKGISASILRNDLRKKDFNNFATNYPDVPKEVVKDIYSILKGTVTENVLLTEGGGAGHLAHPYEDVTLTFADVQNMIDASLQGNLQLAQEKLDGQNLMVSFKNGRLIAARNKGQLKNFGENALTIEQMKKQFSNRGEIQVAFVEAMRDMEIAVSKLSPQEKEEIFQDGKNFISLEVLYPGTANVIPYGAAQLRLHHVKAYDEGGNVESETQEPIARLQTALDQQEASNQKTYKIRATDPASIKPDEDYKLKREEFVSELNKIKSEFSLKDDDRLAKYFYRWWKRYIQANASNYGYKVPDDVLKALIKRWAFTDKTTNIKAIRDRIKDDSFREWVTSFDKTGVADQKKIAGRPVEMLFLKLGARVLKNIENLVTLNPDASVRQIKVELRNAINQIRSAAASPEYVDGDVALTFLKRELARLKEIGGFKAIVPTEGLVFTYNNKLYKLTGSFAPINQILGYLKY